MTQYVKSVCYLAKRVIDVKNYETSVQAIALPTGAEIVQISLEVLESCAGATADVKFENAVLGNDVDIDTKKSTILNYVGTIAHTGTLDVELSQKCDSGVIVLKCMYFLPSEIKTEF